MAKKCAEKLKDKVRVRQVEIASMGENWGEVKDEWYRLADAVKQMTNYIWQQWELYHSAHSSVIEIRGFLDAYAQWKAESGPSKPVKPADGSDKKELAKYNRALKKWKAVWESSRPSCSVQAVPGDWSNQLESRLKVMFPGVHGRVVHLVHRRVTGGIKNLKASKGSLPGWMAVLLCHQGRPSFVNELPIPFDINHSQLVPPLSRDEPWKFVVSTDRVPQPKKKVATSHKIACELVTWRKKAWKTTEVLERIVATGGYRGGNLVCRGGKWFVLIAYRDTQKPRHDLDPAKTAMLIPGKRRPWILVAEGSRLRFWANGQHIEAIRDRTSSRMVAKQLRHDDVARVRDKLVRNRKAKQENYRYSSGKAAKGHGRERATVSWTKERGRWDQFVKLNNNNLTRAVIRYCHNRGIGTLIYCQPDGTRRDDRYLTTAGKLNRDDVPWARSVRDSTSWAYFQVGKMLQDKAEGIAVMIKKIKRLGAKRNSDDDESQNGEQAEE